MQIGHSHWSDLVLTNFCLHKSCRVIQCTICSIDFLSPFSSYWNLSLILGNDPWRHRIPRSSICQNKVAWRLIHSKYMSRNSICINVILMQFQHWIWFRRCKWWIHNYFFTCIPVNCFNLMIYRWTNRHGGVMENTRCIKIVRAANFASRRKKKQVCHIVFMSPPIVEVIPAVFHFQLVAGSVLGHPLLTKNLLQVDIYDWSLLQMRWFRLQSYAVSQWH